MKLLLKQIYVRHICTLDLALIRYLFNQTTNQERASRNERDQSIQDREVQLSILHLVILRAFQLNDCNHHIDI